MSERLLIQGDSLPLPRGPVPYEETWPWHLRVDDRFPHVINRSQSGKTTDELHTDKVRFPRRKLELYEPETVVMQIGIVDCAPRLLSKTERDLITAFPFETLARVSSYAAKRLRGRTRRRTYVSEGEFEANLRDYLERADEHGIDHLVVLKILTAGEKYTAKNPDVQEAITTYNEIIDRLADEFPFVQSLRPLATSKPEEESLVDDHTLEDGYHLNAAGHERLYERLLEESPLGQPQPTATMADD